MKVIAQANKTVLKILKNFRKPSQKNRLLHYCVAEPVDEGMLLFNTLTREMVLLTQEEYEHCLDNAYLQERWFVVPEDTDEKAYTNFVRTFYKRSQQPDEAITHYTIFPTTDCNARCFYCFELGRSRIPMSQETAEKVAQYIVNHCSGKPVTITWFGGEPLYNAGVIDTICNGLRSAGVTYKSSMVSNGYLFDDELVAKAANLWNLHRIQITLDGTEEVYNKIKAFIYPDTNAYKIVLANIEKLLNASIRVYVRLNMDLANAKDLVELVDQLAARFENKQKLSVYAHHLFKNNESLANTYSVEEWLEREEAMLRLEQAIARGGLTIRNGISQNLKQNHCMADNDHAVTILPDGNIGCCEHFSETQLAGHIDREGFDKNVMEAWKERSPEVPECATCFYYPQCFMLKNCSNENVCFLQYRQGKERVTRRQMLVQYDRWLNKITEENDEELD